MNYQEYQDAYFSTPTPEPRFHFTGSFGVTLFFEDYDAAVSYYQQVLGPPAYVEDQDTRGWQIGSGWLTILEGESSNPQNVEVQFQVDTPKEAERLQMALIEAGGTGAEPSDQLMYNPIRSCPVRDPFGTDLLIFSLLSQE